MNLGDVRAAFAEFYAIDEELGRGGMACVFRARRRDDDATVAVKVIRPEISIGIGYKRFRREIELLMRLDHPHILPLLETGEAGPFLYYTMPCAAGESLKARLVRTRHLPLADVLAVASQIGAALDYAHAHGVLHRDIKPENILWHEDRWMLCDFGVARALEAAAPDSLSPSGMVIGTPQYMSPEQGTAGKQLDGRSDLYALGCVLYESLAGQLPFTGATPQAIIARHVKAPVPKLRLARPDVPEHVEAAIEWMLQKKPRARPRRASEAVERLATTPTR
ncbi:MAG TPA: serine/threonine-protein kinase [Gemmatimonadales bacterium]|jgi:serine/threonine-protein kinase